MDSKFASTVIVHIEATTMYLTLTCLLVTSLKVFERAFKKLVTCDIRVYWLVNSLYGLLCSPYS